MARNEDEFAKIFAFVMTDPPFIPRPVLNVMARERIRNYELEKRILKEIASDSAEKYVTGLKTLTLIVFGEKDRVINPASAEILHKLMPRSEVNIMKGIGHLPMIEQPRKSAEDYLKFRAAIDQVK
jgi:pimeloyl-ACP methyl ester carboxylesterase